ncbi:hypothetical protein GEMRC1_004270 [Eukaryota sp. GEM-RC1]
MTTPCTIGSLLLSLDIEISATLTELNDGLMHFEQHQSLKAFSVTQEGKGKDLLECARPSSNDLLHALALELLDSTQTFLKDFSRL